MKVRRGWYLLPHSGTPYHGVVPEGAEVLDGPPAAEDPAPPAPSAPKAAWVEYAVSQGWSPEDAQRKTKQALVDELGEQDIDAGESDGPVGSEVAGDDLGADTPEGDLIEGGPVSGDDGFDGDLDRHDGAG